MNTVVLTGRVVNELDLRTLANGTTVTTVTIAVDRDYKDAKGEKISDFFDVTVWRQQAEFITQYANKGDLVGVAGQIQKRNYEKDGQKIWVTEIVAKEIQILSRKEKENEHTVNDKQTTVVRVDKLADEDDMPF
jgi:single-strand DNA-binding protein